MADRQIEAPTIEGTYRAKTRITPLPSPKEHIFNAPSKWSWGAIGGLVLYLLFRLLIVQGEQINQAPDIPSSASAVDAAH